MKALCWTGLGGIIMAVLTENSSSRYQIWFRLSFLPKVYVVASFHTCLEDCVTARDPVNRASGCWYTDMLSGPWLRGQCFGFSFELPGSSPTSQAWQYSRTQPQSPGIASSSTCRQHTYSLRVQQCSESDCQDHQESREFQFWCLSASAPP